MKKYLICVVGVVLLSCTTSNSIASQPVINTQTAQLPSYTSEPKSTITPMPPVARPTIPVAEEARPVFLSWPLPSYIGTTKIEQYPNTAWSWNYLGLNEGQQCPAAYASKFANLIYPYYFPYWRDESIPIERDRAQADPHGFGFIECYSTDENVGANGHAATDIETPDLAETPVFAAADGKVMVWRLSGWNSFIALKHCLGGTWDENSECVSGKQWYTTYMHIIPNVDFLVKNMDIAQGTQIARVLYLADRTHLHFEVGVGTRSFLNFVNPWGDDAEPWLGCMWIDQKLCVNPNPDYKHFVFYTNSERLFIKHAEANPIEIYDAKGLKKFSLVENQIAVLDSDHRLFYQTGKFDYAGESMLGWQVYAEHVIDFQITRLHTAIVDNHQNFLIRENEANSEWILEAEHVRAFSISDHRVGYLTEAGDLYVKEGILNAEWIRLAEHVQAFQLNDNHVVIVDKQGNMYANEGKLPASWEYLGSGAKAFQLTNNRLGMINAENILMIKEGNIRANWIAIADKVAYFQLADDRILIKDENGLFKLKEGSLYHDWVELLFTDAKTIILNGELPNVIE